MIPVFFSFLTTRIFLSCFLRQSKRWLPAKGTEFAKLGNVDSQAFLFFRREVKREDVEQLGL